MPPNPPVKLTVLRKVLSLIRESERWVDAGNPPRRLEPSRPLWLRLGILGPTPFGNAHVVKMAAGFNKSATSLLVA